MGRKPKITTAQQKKIFAIIKPNIDPKTGKQFRTKKGHLKWKGITKAARELGVTSPTIYTYLEKREKAHERELRKYVKPKYIEEFEESDAVKTFREARNGTVSDKTFNKYMTRGILAWRILNKKDPIDWDEDDYRKLWRHHAFRMKETGKISAENASALRQWMEHCKRLDLMKAREFKIKGLKGEKGKYKTHWIKSRQGLEDVINFIEYPDTLMMFNIGIQCGGRFSSMRLIKPVDVEYVTNTIYMRETKVGKPVERMFITSTLETLRTYIKDFNFKGNQLIFPRRINLINADLKQAGLKAGIPFKLTTHKAIKHTYVSIASNRGISLDIVSDMTGTDPSTLKDFYAGIGKKRMRHEILGEEYVEEPFTKLMEKLQIVVRKRYEEIKDRLHAINGLSKRPPKKKKVKKKRPIKWKNVAKMIKAKGTPEHLKNTWKKALRLHNKGLSDKEVRREMGWKT